MTERIVAPILTTLHTTLADGTPVTIRPLTENDCDALSSFGLSLPPNDRLYLEDDLQSHDIITRLINAHAAENWRQLVASIDDEIAGYAAVRQLPGWSNHVGSIMLAVSDGCRRRGLGTLLGQAVFDAARDLGVHKVIVEMLAEQCAGRAIFERLGFQVEGVLSKHARDRAGQVHDLLIMAYHVEV